MPDDDDGEQDETDIAALLGNSGEDPEADDALAEALQLDAVAMVAWQRFSGKGTGKSKGKGKAKGKSKSKRIARRVLPNLRAVRIVEDQQAFVDARTPLDHDGDEPAADPPEDRPAENPDAPETPRSVMEPEFEHGNTPPRTRPRSSEDPLDDSPFALRRRVEIPSQQLDLTSGEFSLTDHWRRSDTTGSGVGLIERQHDRERDETDALVAFYTDRGVGYKYRPKKGCKSSKNIRFEAPDQFTQAGLTESRKAEWAKWKQFNAVYPVSRGPKLRN